MPEVATPNQAEREFETGSDEFFKARSELNAVNAKRTYDEFQDISLTSARRSQSHFDDINARTISSFDQLQSLQAKINEEHFASLHELRKHLTATNAKRTYDAYQDLDLVAARRAQVQFDQIQNIALQALQNSVETANMVAKQAVRHSDIAIDNQWNPVQQGTGDNLTGSLVADTKVAAKAVDAATAKAVDATTTTLVATLTEMLKVLSAMSEKIAKKA